MTHSAPMTTAWQSRVNHVRCVIKILVSCRTPRPDFVYTLGAKGSCVLTSWCEPDRRHSINYQRNLYDPN